MDFFSTYFYWIGHIEFYLKSARMDYKIVCVKSYEVFYRPYPTVRVWRPFPFSSCFLNFWKNMCSCEKWLLCSLHKIRVVTTRDDRFQSKLSVAPWLPTAAGTYSLPTGGMLLLAAVLLSLTTATAAGHEPLPPKSIRMDPNTVFILWGTRLVL